MQVRLAFSIAIKAKGDILLLDEVLAVGDADFQRKCFSYFKKLKKDKKTVVFVSHDMDAIREYCDRAVLIDDSEIIAAGTSEAIAKEYTRLFLPQQHQEEAVEEDRPEKWGIGGIDIHSISSDKKRYSDRDKYVQVTYRIKADPEMNDSLMVGLTIKNEQGQSICGTNSKIVGYKKEISIGNKGDILVSWRLPNIFNEGTYTVEPAVDSITSGNLLQWWDDAYQFSVVNDHKTPYIVAPEFDLEIS